MYSQPACLKTRTHDLDFKCYTGADVLSNGRSQCADARTAQARSAVRTVGIKTRRLTVRRLCFASFQAFPAPKDNAVTDCLSALLQPARPRSVRVRTLSRRLSTPRVTSGLERVDDREPPWVSRVHGRK